MAFANADLRRLQLAQAGSLMGTWAYAVALAVYAYDVDGATGVAIVTLFRLVPAALAAPFTSALGDRLGRARVMLATDFLRASVMGVMAVGIWFDAPPLLIYAFSGISPASNTAFRPPSAHCFPASPARRMSSRPRMSLRARSRASACSSGRRSGPAARLHVHPGRARSERAVVPVVGADDSPARQSPRRARGAGQGGDGPAQLLARRGAGIRRRRTRCRGACGRPPDRRAGARLRRQQRATSSWRSTSSTLVSPGSDTSTQL